MATPRPSRLSRHGVAKHGHLGRAFLVGLTLSVAPRAATAQSTACVPEPDRDAAGWLQRSRQALGLDRLPESVLHYRAMQATSEPYQSDRTSYPPYFDAMAAEDHWLDVRTGVERVATLDVWPGSGPNPGAILVSGPDGTFLVPDSAGRMQPQLHPEARVVWRLDPWSVLLDWQRSKGVSVVGRCPYRDEDRVVLTRTGPEGAESLFLDPETSLPVKLTTSEPHYLWGRTTSEYVFTNWNLVRGGPAVFPSASFRVVDGETEISRTVGDLTTLPSSGAPRLDPADISGAVALAPTPAFLRPEPPDTVRLGPNTYLLRNHGYREVVTLASDTIFVLDATQGEARARQDSAWLGRLFPGVHPIVLIVTDLAWPHIAGLRFWVASGATVVSHRASRPLLEQVVDRSWRTEPDRLERRRDSTTFVLSGVTHTRSLAAGALQVIPIDGIGSEGALVVYVGDADLLWASDYIQTVSQPSLYALEVWRAVRRAGVEPSRAVAQHLDPTPWSVVDALLRGIDEREERGAVDGTSP